MAKTEKPTTVKATVTFQTWHVDDDGRPVEVTIGRGHTLPADHPIVEGHREFFEETATA